MKKSVVTVAFLLGIVLLGPHPAVWGHRDLTPQEAKALIDTSEELLVVDVREDESEYCDEDPVPPVPPGHIPGALNYPWTSGVLEERYTDLPLDGEILVVCRSGHRSNEAAEFLDSKGYLHIYDMLGGMGAWEWNTVVCIDSDEDDFNDDLDNCPDDYNPDQGDSDQDGLGDICDNTTPCPVEQLFGNHSSEAKRLRTFRDTALNTTPAGREIIRLYYAWAPAVARAMEEDTKFKKEVKELIELVLPIIR